MAAQSLREAVKIGCKDLLADQEHLLSELNEVILEQQKN